MASLEKFNELLVRVGSDHVVSDYEPIHVGLCHLAEALIARYEELERRISELEELRP